MSKFKSALLFLLENVVIYHELLGRSFYYLLIAETVRGFRKGCVVEVTNEESIGHFATNAIIFAVWHRIFVFGCFQSLWGLESHVEVLSAAEHVRENGLDSFLRLLAVALRSRARIRLNLVLMVHEFEAELTSIDRCRFFDVLFLLVARR